LIYSSWIYIQYWARYNQNKNIYYLTSITTSVIISLFYANFWHFQKQWFNILKSIAQSILHVNSSAIYKKTRPLEIKLLLEFECIAVCWIQNRSEFYAWRSYLIKLTTLIWFRPTCELCADKFNALKSCASQQ
jgi:hypothetical protein